MCYWVGAGKLAISSFNILMQMYKENATDKDGNLNKDYIDEELTSEVIAQLLTDESYINELAKTNRNLVQKIFDVLVDFFDKITGRYTSDTKNMSDEMKQAVAEVQKDFEHIKKLYQTALDSTENKQGKEMVLPSMGQVMHSDVLNSKNYSMNVNHYSEKEYNDFGWARANNILNEGENADYRSKFAMAVTGNAKFAKSKYNEYIIPVSDIYDKDFRGINNVLVFAKGKIDKPIITSIIRIYEYDENILADTRRIIYELERRGIQQETGDTFGRYHAYDFRYSQAQQNIILQSNKNSENNELGEENSRATSKSDENAPIDNDKLYSKSDILESETDANIPTPTKRQSASERSAASFELQ